MKRKSLVLFVKSHPDQESHPTICFSQETMKKFRLKKDNRINVSGGVKTEPALTGQPVEDNFIKLSKSIMISLGLREGDAVGVSFQSPHSIRLGPYIGAFVSTGSMNSIMRGKPHSRTLELQKAAIKEGAVLYFFSLGDLDFASMTIYGLSYNTRLNIWERSVYPCPDILYDRAGGFSPKQKVSARMIRRQLTRLDAVTKFNSRHYFNKWDLHKRLSTHRDISAHLPDTVQFTGPDSLSEMLEKYPLVYLKGTEGSNGKEVIRARKTDSGQIEINYFGLKNTVEVLRSANELTRNIITVFGLDEFIIQQGIEVLQHDGRNLDLRALVQRNGRGKWQITAVPVRVSIENCAITSTRTGASCYPFDDAFDSMLGFSPARTKKIKKDLGRLLQIAVNAIEKEYGPFGELGIDIALCKNGKLWFIECNAKPGKTTIILSGNEEAYMKSFLRPIQYCKLLAGFGETDD